MQNIQEFNAVRWPLSTSFELPTTAFHGQPLKELLQGLEQRTPPMLLVTQGIEGIVSMSTVAWQPQSFVHTLKLENVDIRKSIKSDSFKFFFFFLANSILKKKTPLVLYTSCNHMRTSLQATVNMLSNLM